MRELQKKEASAEKKIRHLEKVLTKMQKRQKYARGFTILKLLIKAFLFSAPLWLLFALSFETEISLHLSLWGILLLLLLYFGTLGMYFYFRYYKRK
jgi:Flp pilus assembly protein TadB